MLIESFLTNIRTSLFSPDLVSYCMMIIYYYPQQCRGIMLSVAFVDWCIYIL